MKNLIFLVLVFSCLNCKEKESIKVAFLFPHFKSDRYLKEKDYFTEKVKELGGEAIIVDANYDQDLQIKQSKDFLDQGLKVLVLGAVNANLAAIIVREAHEKHAVVIAYDRLIKNADLDLYLSFQYQLVGKEMVDYITKLKPEGEYLIIGGDKSDYNAVQVNKGQMNALDSYVKSGKIKIMYNIFIEEWNPENAGIETEYYLNLSDHYPDAIICSSDRLASGVIKTLEKHEIEGKVLITGMDADKLACRHIIEGKQTMSVYKPFKKLAFLAAESAMKMAKGQKITDINDKIWNGKIDVPSILIEPIAVDKNNLKSTVIADGLISEKEIYSK
jgi:D-xylose transport system substrate-binding protein